MKLPLFPFILLVLVAVTLACDQVRQGCKISGHSCVCGTGCYSEYRYSSKDECRRALKGRRNRDICTHNPCYNNGACSQTSLEPGYRCRCVGTGFYGERCQHDCTHAAGLEETRYPYECVVI